MITFAYPLAQSEDRDNQKIEMPQVKAYFSIWIQKHDIPLDLHSPKWQNNAYNADSLLFFPNDSFLFFLSSLFHFTKCPKCNKSAFLIPNITKPTQFIFLIMLICSLQPMQNNTCTPFIRNRQRCITHKFGHAVNWAALVEVTYFAAIRFVQYASPNIH